MGNLIRRFWLPALVPSELPAPDCPPIRFRIASEDLVAFRDTTGKVGFVANACPHRGASLFFGRNEEAGLRCVYHGWKFDTTGACVDMPSEPAESNFKSKVRVKAYPAAEHGGLVWIYMGPPEKQPELPQFDWTCTGRTPEPQGLQVAAGLQLQPGRRGFLDTAHICFLHRNFKRAGVGSRNVDPNTALRWSCRRPTSASSTAGADRPWTVATTGASPHTSSPGSRRFPARPGTEAVASSCRKTTSIPGGSRSHRRACAPRQAPQSASTLC